MSTMEAITENRVDVRDTSVPVGYRGSPVGMVPEGWESVPLSELFEFKNGANADKRAYGHGIPFANVLEVITNSHLRTSDIPGRVSLTQGAADSYRIQYGDVLFNRTSETQEELGLASVYLDDDIAVFGGFVIRGRPKSNSLNPIYAGYALRANFVRSQITTKGQGAIRANIGQADLRQVHALRPQIDEQQEIAAALTDADCLIGTLDKLITKQRAIKQATMQQLLSGRTRLEGFAGTWRETTLAEVVISCSSGSTPSRSRPEFYRGDIRWITSGELNYGAITETKEKITPEAARDANLKIVPAGTFLMAVTGLEAEGTRGSCGIVGADSTTNQSCMAIFLSEQLLSEYLFYYYVYKGKALALQYCQGTKQQSYTAATVKKLPIRFPAELDEQRAIAALLFDIDAEIAALEHRRGKTKAIKQGMMQALLTGRIRLVKPEALHE
jgi:type I restriction enzyme S subunit